VRFAIYSLPKHLFSARDAFTVDKKNELRFCQEFRKPYSGDKNTNRCVIGCNCRVFKCPRPELVFENANLWPCWVNDLEQEHSSVLLSDWVLFQIKVITLEKRERETKHQKKSWTKKIVSSNRELCHLKKVIFAGKIFKKKRKNSRSIFYGLIRVMRYFIFFKTGRETSALDSDNNGVCVFG